MSMKRIVQLRKENGWTQQDLADKSGFSRSSIINWETGKRAPRTVDLEKLADIFGVNLQYLIGGEIENVTPKKTGNNEMESFAFWGNVVDKARELVKNNKLQEITLITPLLKSVVDMFLSVQGQSNENKKNSPAVSYGGFGNNYHENVVNMNSTVTTN